MSDPGLMGTLFDLDRRLGQTEVREQRGGSGTAFPTGITSGFRFFRTDLGFDCYYDGTRWLTAHEYEANLGEYSVTGYLPYAGAAPQTILYAPRRTDYTYYVTRARITTYVVAPNTGAAFWSLQLFVGGTVLWSPTTAADTAAVLTDKEQAVNAVSGASGLNAVNVSAKTGAPGAIHIFAAFWYRLIVT